MRNGFKFLKQVENKMNQFETVFKSLERFSTHFRVKESLAINHATVWQQKNFTFSGPCRRVRTAKLTNHSAGTNLEIS